MNFAVNSKVFILTLLFAFALGSAALAQTDYPQLFLEYHPSGFDSTLSKQLTGFEPPEEWRREAVKSAPEFQVFWDKFAPTLLTSTVKVVGIPWKRKEETAILHLCPKIKTQASPFLIYFGHFLKAPTDGKPNSKSVFVEMVYHEMLHLYIGEILHKKNNDTPLIRKYFKEGTTVVSHLHLMAIQSKVYQSLQKPDLIRQAKLVGHVAGPGYDRAWEIVEEEGADTFVAELQPSDEDSVNK
jgi:hypothetical protein